MGEELDFENGLSKFEKYKFARTVMPYISMNVTGLTFFSDSKDFCISDAMLYQNKVWSKEEIEFFVSKGTGNMTGGGGYFLDIGANIGTTCIYASKLLPDFKFIAFEPMKNNYKTLCHNCIENDCHSIKTENVGLSDACESKSMFLDEKNFGACAVLGIEGKEFIHSNFETLDYYVQKNNIDPKEIKYIWIDTQGHESDILAGAVDTLKKSPAIVFMEYSIFHYKSNNKYERILNNLQEIYSYYVCYQDYEKGDCSPKKISNLKKLEKEYGSSWCDILLLKEENYNNYFPVIYSGADGIVSKVLINSNCKKTLLKNKISGNPSDMDWFLAQCDDASGEKLIEIPAQRKIYSYVDCVDFDISKSIYFNDYEEGIYNANQYVAFGISGNEHTFTWSDGNKITLCLKFKNMNKGEKLNFVLDIAGVFFRPQRMIIKSNEKIRYEGVVDGEGKIRVPVNVDENFVSRIEFELPDAISPKKAGVGEDKRNLAVQLKKISFYTEKKQEQANEILKVLHLPLEQYFDAAMEYLAGNSEKLAQAVTEFYFKDINSLRLKDFVNLCYKHILNRKPNEHEFKTYLAHLTLGINRKDVINLLLSSDEFKEKSMDSKKNTHCSIAF